MGEAKRRQGNVPKKQVVKGVAPTTAECDQLVALFKAGHLAELENGARSLLERYPDSGFAWKALGASLQMQGKNALSSLQKAVQFSPNDADAQNNLGNALKNLGQLDKAIASYHRALEIEPTYAMAHYNLGCALQDLGQLDDAVASCQRALALKPDYAEAHISLGNLLQSLGQLDGAIASFRRALEIKPDFSVAHNSLGNALRGTGQLDDAVASYRHAIMIKPDFADAHNNLGNALRDLGQLDDAVASCRRALEAKPDSSEAYSNLLFGYNLLPNPLPASMLAEAQRYGEMVARHVRPYEVWSNIPELGKCLRVGFVSGDLRAHPVGYFLESMLTALSAHAAGRLEFFAYPNHPCTDTVTGQIKARCRGWYSAVGLSDETLAQRIHDDEIDILIDLSGHTAHNRLPVFAWKPAPIQATWLGYLATTGVAAMDYLIADPWTLPETEDIHFTEKIWRLPETYLYFTPPDVDEQVSQLPALTNGYITFGCFNNLAKMNNDVVALWARVLASVPNSRLFLKAKQLEAVSVQQSIIERFAVHGIGADRLILKGPVHRAGYLAPYQQVDIALDPFPYTGTTTSVEGLWMGVPMLTLAGKSFLSRQGVGLLMNAGLPEWVATDADDYVARAISHAGDLQRLAALRNGLRQQMLASPIFDAPRFARHFEAALRGMWTQWCNQQQEKILPASKDSTPSNRADSMQVTRRLHIGGKTKSDGWEVLNANPASYVDHVCNANDLSQFADNTFIEIYASHIIEHLDYINELPDTLKEWNRVLMSGGKLFISVPDLDILAKLILEKHKLTLDERFHVMRMIFGGHMDKYDYHVVGLNEEFLTGYLDAAGYVNIRKISNFGLFNDTSSKLLSGVAVSLNMIAEKRHASKLDDDLINNRGRNRPYFYASSKRI